MPHNFWKHHTHTTRTREFVRKQKKRKKAKRKEEEEKKKRKGGVEWLCFNQKLMKTTDFFGDRGGNKKNAGQKLWGVSSFFCFANLSPTPPPLGDDAAVLSLFLWVNLIKN